jgi:hypothetical protein
MAVLFLILLTNCESEKQRRPSPLTKDSLQINDTKIWRTGANEATVFETTREIYLNRKPLPAGKYAIFSIPNEENWTIIFNKDWEQWGSFGYDPKNDIARFLVIPDSSTALKENMEFVFSADRLIFQWEYLTFDIEIQTTD